MIVNRHMCVLVYSDSGTVINIKQTAFSYFLVATYNMLFRPIISFSSFKRYSTRKVNLYLIDVDREIDLLKRVRTQFSYVFGSAGNYRRNRRIFNFSPLFSRHTEKGAKLNKSKDAQRSITARIALFHRSLLNRIKKVKLCCNN